MKKFKFSRAALLIAGALTYPTISSAAEEDAVEDESENKVVVTGSRIKRTQGAGALPVTVITKAQLQENGITSAEQLMLQLNITANSTDNLASNNGITSSDNRGNNGFSGANLRQQGADSTLVLLNGRRVATHGMKGRAVDINSIPFAAIERIEILRDGASAVYGTDAIGGVINFIMKRDYQGLEVSGFTDITEAGGGNINRFSIVGGFGDMIEDGYNVVATLAYKDNKILKGTDRDFTNTFQPDRGLSPDTRGPQFASLNDRWRSPNDPTSNHYNLIGSGIIDPNTGQEAAVLNILDLPGGLGCDAFPNQGPYDHLLWNSASSEFACAWDYPRASVLRQPVETTNFIVRATKQVNEQTEFFAEIVASQVVADKVFEPIQVTPWSLVGSDGSGNQHWLQAGAGGYQLVVDALSDYFGADQLNLGAPIAYRWRCIPCGPRQIETTTDALRVLIGWEGSIGDWDWETGFSYASSEGSSLLKGGYYFEDAIAPIFGSGAIDPFLLPGQSHSQAGLDALAAASAAGTTLFSGKSTMKHIDFSISGDTGWELPGGNVMVATGLDLRREDFGFNGDRRENTRRIDAAPFDESNILDNVSRDVTAIYGEALLPIVDSFEITLALRHDRYDGFGGTTNPKISFKFNPIDEVLFRGAYNTGFRVPSFNQLFSGVRAEDFTGQDMVDPLTCSTGVVDEADPNCQRINPNIIQGGKEDLDPEESVQASIGVVLAPMENLNVSIDWWSIKKEGTIQLPGLTTLINNFEVFQDNFIRDDTGRIVAIDNRWVNAGERKTSGVEMDLNAKGDIFEGSWDYNLNVSYLIEDKKRIRVNLPFEEDEVGKHTRRNIPLEWKLTNRLGFTQGDLRHTLTHVYRDGYVDEVPPGVAAGVITPINYDPNVDSYNYFNYSLTYSGIENVVATFGIKNVLDTDPPFTAHQNDFSPGAAFDPRVADPRGRAFTFLVEYKFF